MSVWLLVVGLVLTLVAGPVGADSDKAKVKPGDVKVVGTVGTSPGPSLAVGESVAFQITVKASDGDLESDDVSRAWVEVVTRYYVDSGGLKPDPSDKTKLFFAKGDLKKHPQTLTFDATLVILAGATPGDKSLQLSKDPSNPLRTLWSGSKVSLPDSKWPYIYVTVTADTTAPSGSLTINSGALYTKTTAVTLNLQATDAVGVTQYKVKNGANVDGASAVAVGGSPTSFTLNLPWDVESGDGAKQVSVSYGDAAGNWSPYTAEITLDTTAPVIVINAPADSAIYTEGSVPALNYTVTDNLDPGPSHTPTGYGATAGTHTVTVNASDAAGNTATASITYTVDPAPVPDTQAPEGTLDINSGAPYTNTTAVTLNLSATDNVGVAKYRVADGTDASGGTVVPVDPAVTPFSDDVPWTLPAGDGPKQVSVQYQDAAGNRSPNYTATIMLDTTPPTITIVAPVSATYTEGSVPELNYTVTDNLDPSPSHTATGYGATVGEHTVTVNAADAAGNTATASITYTVNPAPVPDAQAPVGSLGINNGASYTKNPGVTLNLSATDNVGVAKYRVADGTDASGGTVVSVDPAVTPFSDDVPWTLPSGDGPKQVSVQYQDAAGNWSPNYTATIKLDTTPPTITIVAPVNGASYSVGAVPSLNYTVTDNVDPGPSHAATGYGTTAGTHTVTVNASDAAGNTATASVTYTVTAVSPPSPPPPSPPPPPPPARGSVAGRAINPETGLPIAGATISIFKVNPGLVATILTDASGRYRVDGLEPGVYRVEVSHSGFVSDSPFLVTVAGGETTTLNILMFAVVQVVVAPAPPAAAPAPTLPGTGLPADAYTFAGLALICAGLALRRRTAR